MLESMRKHAQGWLAKVILGAIIVAFSLWGVEGYFSGNQIETVAEVDGEIIHNVEFGETYRRQLASYANMLGDQFSKELADKLGVKEETIQTMINRKLMLMEAASLGLVVPDQAVLGTVRSTPAFQQDNSFNVARYEALVRQMGFISPRNYENYLRQSIVIDTLQKGVIESAVVSDEEVMARFKRKFEKRVLAALIVKPEALQADIEVTDSQARDWYDAHDSLYQSPLKVELQAVEINAANLIGDMEINEDDIQEAYEAQQSEFSAAEKRRISHILVRVAKDASEAVFAMAEQKINAAQQRIVAGESFADVAKDVSDDITSSDGGNLGFFAKGAMVAEFEDAVFSQLAIDEVSDVLRTQFGLHLVQLKEVQTEQMQPLADVRDAIEEQLVQQAAADEAYRLSEDLDNALGMEDSLAAAAATVNLPVIDLGKLSSENVLANVLLATSEDLQKKAFSMLPGDAVEIVEVENGHFVALEVLNRFDPETMAYDKVVNRVYADVRADEAGKQAQNIANDIHTAAVAGESIDSLAQKFAQPKYISKAIVSSGEGDTAPWLQAVLQVAFSTPESRWVDAPLPTAQGIAIVYVQDVQEADAATYEAEAEAMRDEAVKAKGAVRFARWMASVRDRHEISVNNRVLDRF